MDKKKRYLFVIPSLVGGGAERVMVTLANNLCKEADVKIATITSATCFYDLDECVDVISANCPVNRNSIFSTFISKVKGFFRTIRLLDKTVKVWKADTIVVFLHEAIILTIIAKLLFRWKCKLVVSERADPKQRGIINAWLEKQLYPYANTIVCQSKNVADFFKSSVQKKIKIIPNPICENAIPEMWQGSRKRKIVGVGRLFPQKNFNMLIKAFAKLNSEQSDYFLEIYGEGYLQEDLQKQINELNLQNKIKLMGARKNVMYHIADCSLFVLTSDFEGFPNVLVEAMATGLPVITTDFSPGNAPEIVKEQNGIIVQRNNVDELVDAMKIILGNEKLANEMSKENRKKLTLLNENRICDIWREILS